MLVNAAAWALVNDDLVVKPLTTWRVVKRRFDWFQGRKIGRRQIRHFGRGQAGAWLLVNAAAWALVKATIPGRWSSRWPPGWWSRRRWRTWSTRKLGRGETGPQLSRGQRGDLAGFHGGRIRRRQTHHFCGQAGDLVAGYAAAWALVKTLVGGQAANTWLVVKAAI